MKHTVKIIIKVFAVIGALALLMYDTYRLKLGFADGSTETLLSVIEYYAIPLGACFGITAFLDIFENSVKKLFALLTIIFAGIFIFLKALAVILSIAEGVMFSIEVVYQALLYLSNILLYSGIIIYCINLRKKVYCKKLETAFAVLLTLSILVLASAFITYATSFGFSFTEFFFNKYENYAFLLTGLSYVAYVLTFLQTVFFGEKE